MSQQLFAICLVAVGMVALVSGQSFNPQDCAQRARKSIEEFSQNMMQSTQKFTNNLQSTGSQAMDMSAIQEDVDKLTQSMSSVTDMSQGFDMGKYTSLYMENMQTLASIMRKSFRMNLMTGTMDNYIEYGNSMMTAYTRVMQQMTSACVPTVRVQPL